MRGSVLLLLVLVLPPVARADDEPELTVLIAEAVERSPEIRAARELAEAALQRIRPSEALPDPMVSLGYQNEGGSPSLGTETGTWLQLMAQQAFPFPGKLKLAGRIASSQGAEAGTRAERARLGVEAAVRRAWATLVAARENGFTTDEQIAAWKEIAEITKARYSAGMGNQQDLLRAQSERTRLEQQKVRDEAAADLALVELSRILLRPVESSLASGSRLLPAKVSVPARAAVLAEAEGASPELKEVLLQEERARLEVELARKAFSPDFVAQAAYMNRAGLPLMWSASLGVTVPLWTGSKQRPLLAEAVGRERAARAAEEAVRARLRSSTEARLVRLAQLAREARIDTEGILVQDRLSVDAALASYTSGGVPFVTVLEALGTLFADRRAAVERAADFLKTEADLRELSLDAVAGSTQAAAPSSSAPKM